MNQSVVDVSKDVLKWVENQSGIQGFPPTVNEYLSEWLSDKKKPTYNQLVKVSKATGIPFGYFFLRKPPVEDLSIVEYRTVDSVELLNPSRNLIDIMKSMEAIQDWMHAYLGETLEKCTYVGAMKGQTNIRLFAEYVCKILSLESNWRDGCSSATDLFKIIRNAISNAGTIVMLNGVVGNNTHRLLNIHEFRAFAMVDEIAPLIFINNNDSENGKLFSLVHEFAHICLGENSFFNELIINDSKTRRTEILCNAVAAEVLVPTEGFVVTWNQSTEKDIKDKIISIAKTYCCGTMVIARKALDNGFIDATIYHVIANEVYKAFLEKLSKKKGGGGDFYRTAAARLDHNFLIYLAGSVASGKTSYTDAFTMTNTNRKTYANLMDAVGGLR